MNHLLGAFGLGLLLFACSSSNETAPQDGQGGGAGSPAGGSSGAAQGGSSGAVGSGGLAASSGSAGVGGASGSSGAAGASGSAGVGGSDPTPCETSTEAIEVDVTAASVTNESGDLPVKGDALEITLTVVNKSSIGGTVRLTAALDSLRFSDFTAVPLGTTEVSLCPGETQVTLSGGPFLTDAGDQHYALGRGDYEISAVTLESADAATADTTFSGGSFTIAASNALLVPVIYDANYFEQISGWTGTPAEYMEEVFSRPSQVFTPSGGDPDGAGDFETHAGGFDEMMGVEHLFYPLPGFPGGSTTEEGWCEDAAAYAQTVLGLEGWWNGSGTQAGHHGFDYLIALSPNMGGGVACGWLDVQVSSLINTDVDRQQIVAVHESGHLFGAPHCDDVGNGSGSSLQGYVMCSGEKHANYPEYLVWHSTSLEHMSSHWD